jgi:hypothetical protein
MSTDSTPVVYKGHQHNCESQNPGLVEREESIEKTERHRWADNKGQRSRVGQHNRWEHHWAKESVNGNQGR